jgi:hypothetical protein
MKGFDYSMKYSTVVVITASLLLPEIPIIAQGESKGNR